MAKKSKSHHEHHMDKRHHARHHSSPMDHMHYPESHEAPKLFHESDKMSSREYAENKEHTGMSGPDSLGIASTAHVHHAPVREYPLETMSDGSMNYLQAQHGRYKQDGGKIRRTLLKEYVQ